MPYYAVRNGRQTGVFTTWNECESQVKGFSKPSYRKFATEQEARDFVSSGDKPATTSGYAGGSSFYGGRTFSKPDRSETSVAAAGGSTGSGPFYAVRHGRQTGLFSTWEDCQRQVSGFAGAKFRKFKTEQEATDFVNSGNDPLSVNQSLYQKETSRVSSAKAPHVVYTDGGCFRNGQKGASAGYGVWWGPDHHWNESKRLTGQQTNNRAEIEAAIAAVHRAKREGIKDLEIRTDSTFLIQCMTAWVKKWKQNDWKLSDGKPVKVREPIQRLDRLLDESNVQVTWTHVAGHAGVRGNEAADKLAREGSAKYYPRTIDSDDDLFDLDF